MSRDERYWTMRLGAPAAVLGAICAGVGNILHPVTPRDDPHGVAHVIAGSEHWTLIHVVIVVGIVLMLGGMMGIRASLNGGLPEALARFAVAAAIVGTTLGLATVILDGVGAKQLADAWAAAPAGDQAVALDLVTMNETLNFALAGLFNASFAGIPFLLMGAAVALSRAYPPWLGWAAIAAGCFSLAAGYIQFITGQPTVASLILTIIGPTVISLWLLVMGLLLSGRARAIGVTRAQPADVAARTA
jgi:hypothetical protein